MKRLLLPLVLLLALPVMVAGQLLEWPDPLRRLFRARYSPLTQIASANVKNSRLAWIYRAPPRRRWRTPAARVPAGDQYYWGGPSATVTDQATPR